MSRCPRISSTKLHDIAQALGITYTAILPLSKFNERAGVHRDRLAVWQNNGYAGEMQYMQRDPGLFVDLAAFCDSYRSVVQFLIPYPSGYPGYRDECPPGFGRVARYAWGRDYHKVLPKKLRQLADTVAQELPQAFAFQYRLFTDAVPLLERAMAADSGLGFIGKNTMLMRSGFGSYGFLAEILWNVDIVEDHQPEVVRGSCGSCRRCLTACPTNAFVDEKILDARRCISYLTIEKRGSFSEWEAKALGSWLFGCDVCQEVCPFNHESAKDAQSRRSGIEEFYSEVGAGSRIELETLFAIRDDAQFIERFAATPLLRPKREGLLRNAAAVAANTKSLETVDAMISCYREDESALVRGEILHALKRLEKHADGSNRRRIQAVVRSSG